MEATATQNGKSTCSTDNASCGDVASCERDSSVSRVNVGDLERAISVVAGGACIIMAPSRSISGCLMTLTGLGLMFRAMTGHCFLYQNLGMNTAE
jgi:uncharacterized membrane protein